MITLFNDTRLPLTTLSSDVRGNRKKPQTNTKAGKWSRKLPSIPDLLSGLGRPGEET